MARILVVDDDASIVRAVEHYLFKAGHFVVTASDGKQALELLDQTRFDIILMDIYMPEMGGIELTMCLSQQDDPPRIVVMSAGGQVDQTTLLAMAEKLGAMGTLPKPFTKRELLAAVETV